MYRVTDGGIECMTADEAVELLAKIKAIERVEQQAVDFAQPVAVSVPQGNGSRRHKHWTPGEIAYLRAAFRVRNISELTRMLGRSRGAVTAQGYALMRKSREA